MTYKQWIISLILIIGTGYFICSFISKLLGFGSFEYEIFTAGIAFTVATAVLLEEKHNGEK